MKRDHGINQETLLTGSNENEREGVLTLRPMPLSQSESGALSVLDEVEVCVAVHAVPWLGGLHLFVRTIAP